MRVIRDLVERELQGLALTGAANIEASACRPDRLRRSPGTTVLAPARARNVTFAIFGGFRKNTLEWRDNSPYLPPCPISHVPVAACRSVGIRTRGRTAARGPKSRGTSPVPRFLGSPSIDRQLEAKPAIPCSPQGDAA